MSLDYLTLSAIALIAATVNGALGYGFSSITVPLALLFMTNRTLNPALVLIEVVLNAYVLWINRASIPVVWRRVVPIIVGLVPGTIVGTMLVTSVSPAWLKLWTYLTLLPVVMLQAAGHRRPIRRERAWGLPFGTGLGVLYAVTTISGPPLAAALSNQGLVKRDFRAALGVIRLAEASMTAVAYLVGGLFTLESLALVPYLAPCIVMGVPIGAFVIRHVPTETFRRVCMSFDAWIIAFALSRLSADLHLLEGAQTYLPLLLIGGIDILLLVRFFFRQPRRPQSVVA